MDGWKSEGLKGNDLLADYSSMASWSLLGRAHPLTLKSIKKHLVENDVEMPSTASTLLFDILKGLTNENAARDTRPEGNASSDQSNRGRNQTRDYTAESRGRAETSLMKGIDKEDKYSGDIEENLSKAKTEYIQKCNACDAPEDIRGELAHLILKGPAKDFFNDHISGKKLDVDDAFEELEKEHCAADRVALLESKFTSLRFPKIRKECDSDSKALRKLYEKLKNTQQMLGEEYKGDNRLKTQLITAREKMHFLSMLAKGRPKASSECLRSMLTEIALHEQATGSSSKSKSEDSINLYEQREYANPRPKKKSSKKWKRPKKGQKELNPIGKDGEPLKCHKCGSAFHLISDCGNANQNDIVNCAQGLAAQFEEFGPRMTEDGSSESSSDSSSNSDYDIVVNYVEKVEEFLSHRVELHGMMGENEALCAKKSSYKGVRVDAGAQKCVAGKQQYLAYLDLVKAPNIKLKPSHRVRKFGDSRESPLGVAPTRFPIDDQGNFFEFDCVIVNADAPILLGLDAQMKHGMEISAKHLTLSADGWKAPLAFKHGHIFRETECDDAIFTEGETIDILHSRRELTNMHKKLGRAAADKLHNLMKKAGKDVSNEDLSILKEIGRECYACQKHAKSPNRHMASAPGDIVFNHEVVMDLMHIDSRPVLRMACTGAKFNVAVFLPSKKAETAWSYFLKYWIHPHVGAPHIARIDQGSEFLGEHFITNCRSLGIYPLEAPIESPNSMGVGERCHGPLRRMFCKIKEETPQISDELALSTACKAMNDAMGPEGLAPTLLAHGMMPRLPAGDPNQATPNQAQRMKALNAARSEMEQIVAKLRLKTAADHNLPRTLLDTQASPGMLALAYRNSSKHWEGPYELNRIEGKTAFIKCDPDDPDEEPRPFSVARVKPFLASQEDSRELDEGEENMEALVAKVLGPKEVTEEIMQEFKPAINEEMKGLFDKGAFIRVERSTLPKDANILKSRLALSRKDVGAKKERMKARLVAMGHADQKKGHIISDSPTVMKCAIRLILFLASAFDLTLYSKDVKQAHLQSDMDFQRGVHIAFPKGFTDAQKEYALKIIKPLHGLTEAGSCWLCAHMDFFEKDMKMEPLLLDPRLMLKSENGKLVGLVGILVDDTIGAGTKHFMNKEDKEAKKFIMKPKEAKAFDFSGMHFRQCSASITLEQCQCIAGIKKVIEDKMSMKTFRKLRGKLLWRAQSSRPSISHFAAKLSQVRPEHLETKDIKLLKKAINLLRRNKMRLKYPKLDTESLRIAVYSGAAFAASWDFASQLGFIVLAVDKTNKCCILRWNSYKSQRSIRSVIPVPYICTLCVKYKKC